MFQLNSCIKGKRDQLCRQLLGCLLTLSVILFIHLVVASENFRIGKEILRQAEQRFGYEARERLLAWQRLINEDTSNSDLDKLEKVNSFFNSVDFVSDAIHWGKKDYWATPVEFLASAGGDCEDFSLAKYFTLKLLGVDEKRINLTYVKAWKIRQAHMVLTYYQTPESEPLVLDNLVNEILPASRRDDLLPVYSFNGTGLWTAKERGRGRLVGSSDRLSLWNDLLGRMPGSLKGH